MEVVCIMGAGQRGKPEFRASARYQRHRCRATRTSGSSHNLDQLIAHGVPLVWSAIRRINPRRSILTYDAGSALLGKGCTEVRAAKIGGAVHPEACGRVRRPFKPALIKTFLSNFFSGIKLGFSRPQWSAATAILQTLTMAVAQNNSSHFPFVLNRQHPMLIKPESPTRLVLIVLVKVSPKQVIVYLSSSTRRTLQ